MRTIEVKLYKFDELSEAAQEKALNKWNEGNIDIPWMDENFDSMRKGLEFYDFELKDWSFDYYNASNGYFKIHSRHYYDEIKELSGVRLWKYLQNNYSTYRCKYKGEMKETISGGCPFTGYCVDENFLDPIRAFLKKPTDITFMELMEQCVHECAKAIEMNYEYSQSMEYFKETCEANEYEFTEDGTMH